MSQNRFIVDLQSTNDPLENTKRLMDAVISLTQQLNQANLPVTRGPGEALPEGMNQGQSIIDWSSGTSAEIKVFNGESLI